MTTLVADNPVAVRTTVDAHLLKAAIDRIKPAVSRGGGSLPVLKHYRFDVTDGQMTVTASDLEMTIQARVPAATEEPCAFLLPADTIHKVLVKASGDVTLDSVIDRCVVTVGRTKLSLRTAPIDDWPRSPGVFPQHSVQLDPAVLADVVRAASGDTARPILTSVCIEPEVVVATDSYRLFLVDGLAGMSPTGGPVLVPADAVAQIVRLNGPVTMRVAGNTARFWGASPDDPVVTCRLIDGEFPNWRGLIHTAGTGIEVDDVADLLAAVANVGRYARDATPVRLADRDGQIAVRVVVQDECDVEATVDGRFTCAAAEIAYNPDYLASILAGVEGPALIRAIDHLKPSIVERARPGGGRIVRLIMPVRLS